MKINPVTISKQAILEIKKIVNSKKIPEGYRLRVGIKGGVGCAGVNYIVGFDEPGEFDNEFIIEGVPLLIDKRHTMFLVGVELDFYEGKEERGFKFTKNTPS